MKSSVNIVTGLTILALGWASAPSAGADVVFPPKDGECPEGTDPSYGHRSDPYMLVACLLRTCESNASCTPGRVCAERRFCATGGATSPVICGCSDSSDCRYEYAKDDLPCVPFRVCVEPEPNTAGPSCQLGSRPEANGLPLLAALLAFACVNRRGGSIRSSADNPGRRAEPTHGRRRG